jgi:AraC family transcriptional regulator of adaptative response / DNA-3-methyladenine glycosylase II
MTTGLPPGLDPEVCDRARLARDRAFDGLFFTGVRTTRIYCRPVCPVRPAHSANVRFFGRQPRRNAPASVPAFAAGLRQHREARLGAEPRPP